MKRPSVPAHRPLAPSTQLAFLGLFAVVVGLLLRGAANRREEFDWSGAVRTFLDVFPVVLIGGGLVLLLVAAVALTRSERPPTDER